jgi:hypothetical protein
VNFTNAVGTVQFLHYYTSSVDKITGNYNQVTFGASANITGEFTVGTLNMTSNSAYNLQAGRTVTITNNIAFNSTCSGGVTIQSATAGTQAILSKSSGAVNGQNLTIKDINATGGATYTAFGSNNMGNNAGWTFASSPALGAIGVITANGNAFTIPAVTGAVSYSWTLPAGATMLSGQGTSNIVASIPSGQVCVTALNGCGSTTSSSCYTVVSDYVILNTMGVFVSEDFNTLANTSTSSTMPQGWRISETGTSGNVNNAYTAGTGSNNAGDSYSFGLAGSNLRTLGCLLSGTLSPSFGAKFLNNTNATINSLTITYIGETWRVGAVNRSDRLDFSYSLNASNLATGTWVDIDSLDYVNAPQAATPNGSVVHSSQKNYTIFGLNIPAGSNFFIRWVDSDVTGSDDGMGINDFSIKPCFSVSPPTVNAQTFCGNPTVANLTASGTSLSWYPTSIGNSALANNTALTTSTYYVSQSMSGCPSQRTATSVTVNAAPTLSINASANTLCSGTSATLTASGANSYAWNNGVSNGVAFSPNATQTYTVTGTAANGCTGIAQTTITVNAAPTTNSGTSILGATTCGMNSVVLGGNALAAGQSGTWTLVSGTNANGVFTLPGSNATTFTGSYGGTYVLNWAVQNASTGCIGNDTMVVSFNQPSDAAISAMVGTGDLLWCGLTNTDWSTSTNWYQKQAGGHYIRLSGAVQPSIGNEVFTVNQASGGVCIGNNTPTLSLTSNAEDVYVGPGVTLNLTNDSLNIAQNLINNGTITASIGLVNFTGNTNSIISGTGTTQLFNMRVNKSSGATLTLQQPVSVTNVLTMNQGNVFTTAANLLTLGSSSANTGSLSYNTGTIVGPFKRFFSSSATAGNDGFFPVGTATYNRYADIAFANSPGVNQNLTIEYVTGAPLQGGVPLYNGLPLTASGSLIQNYSANGYWSVLPTAGNYNSSITSTNYNVTLFANNLTGMQSPQVCRIIKSAGSNTAAQNHIAWSACGTHTAIPGNANPTAFAITSTGTQGFSWFNVGTPNSQALPVELLSFTGNCESGTVILNWQTATEHSNDYFNIEKSRDGKNWQLLTSMDAAGNSTQLLNYETTDENKMEGNNYYRLSQVDFDGTTKTYDVINVSCSGASKGYFSVYPNPSTGSFQVILNDKNLVGSGILSVKDTKGAEMLTRTIEVKPGVNMFSVTDLNLAPGVYYIQFVNGAYVTEVLKEVIR